MSLNIPIVKIGNSRGIRIPKNVLERYALGDKVALELKDDHILLKATPAVREGWGSAFQEMAAQGDDLLVIPDMFSEDMELLEEMIGENIIEI